MSEVIKPAPAIRRNERGAARLKFIIVLVVVVTGAYMAFQYLPVTFQSYRFKKAMDESTEQASARGNNGEWLKGQVKASANEYGLPASLKINEPVIRDGRLEIRVQYTRVVNILPFWTYSYDFDYTSKSNTFLNAK